MALDQHDFAQAQAFLDEALVLQRAIGDKWTVAQALDNLGNVTREQGHFSRARTLYLESLTLTRELGDQWALAYLLEDLGILAAMEGNAERALHLAGAAAAMRATIQAPPSPVERKN